MGQLIRQYRIDRFSNHLALSESPRLSPSNRSEISFPLIANAGISDTICHPSRLRAFRIHRAGDKCSRRDRPLP